MPREVVGVLREVLDVAATAEPCPVAGEQHHAYPVVGREVVDRGEEVPREPGVDPVRRLGPVEREVRDAVAHVEKHVVEGHDGRCYGGARHETRGWQDLTGNKGGRGGER